MLVGMPSCALPLLLAKLHYATLFSEASEGARAFLTCVPSGRTHMEPSVLVFELRVRLGIAEATADTWCPKCDAILDTHGHHAGMHMAGGAHASPHRPS